MVAVITGDIVNSTLVVPTLWLDPLKKLLATYGQQPTEWEIFRGDSFQLILKNAHDALATAIGIKAIIKSIKPLDVRMAIGLGEISYLAKRVTESNGSAFVFSGEKFERLKKEKISLALQSSHPQFDRDLNLYIKFAMMTMDNWTKNSAEMVKLAMDHPQKSQQELGELIDIKQNTVSMRLMRAHYDTIEDLLKIYRIKLEEIHGSVA